MKILCSCCGQWTALPPSAGSGAHAHALCELCGAPLAVDDHYILCVNCGQHYLPQYGSCPLCAGPDAQAVEAAAEIAASYSRKLSKRKSRNGQQYWQIYLDYRGESPPAAPLEPAANPDAGGAVPNFPDEPIPDGSHAGHAAAGGLNGSHYDANGYGNEYGNGNGNGNGYVSGPLRSAPANGHAPGASVDLATTDQVSLDLFSDEEVKVFTEEADKPIKVGAGAYNDFDYELIQSPSRLAEVAELLAHEKMVGIDTETTGLDPHTCQLLLLQLSTLDKVYIIDCKRVLPLALKPFLENPGVLKVAQNAKFEYEMLKQQTGITLTSMYDTMLAERVLTAGISREISLKLIAEKYIGAVLDKSIRESFYKTAHIDDAYLSPDQLHYAARDAFIMIPIQQRQVPELKKQRLVQVAELEFKCIAPVGDLELAGVRIDEERWRKIIADVSVQRDQCASELSDILAPASMQATMFGVPSINLNSNVQLIEALYKLGVELPDTMESTLVKYDHPAVKKLLEYRAHEKTLSAFGENVLSLINPKTRRIHPDFNQHGADTGRFSCTKPNVQQIPATSDFRKCFIASPGYKLVTCDYSQCELRILAELSGDDGFVTAFISGGDLHTLTASQMFGVAVDQVEKTQRSAAKAINFGLAYGMGPGGLAPRLGVGLDEAKELIARYFQAYPGVQKWLDKAGRDAVRNGYSTTTIGRKRFYTIPDDSLRQANLDEWRKQISAIERQGKNSPIQGCVAGSTRILVKGEGYVPISGLCGRNIEVWDGDSFVGAHVAASGKKRLVRIAMRGGHYIECSPDHKFKVGDLDGSDRRWEWKAAGEIRTGDRVALNTRAVDWHSDSSIPVAASGIARHAGRAGAAVGSSFPAHLRASGPQPTPTGYQRYASAPVESIEVTGLWVEMYDVVDSETGQFMANGMIVHNSNADMTKLALINLRSALKDWDARVVNTVHDEIVVEVREDQAEEVKHIVEHAMVAAGQTILKVVPIVAEASVADYWSK